MKPKQRSRYAELMERSLQRLEAGVAAGQPPSLAQLAQASAMSEYHFHRVFRLMTGESVGAAITRIRLAHAVAGIQSGDDLQEATTRSGYATSQALARALRANTGESARALRADDERRAAIQAHLAQPGATDMDAPLRIEVVSTEPLRLLAVRNIGAYSELNQGFARVFEWVCEQMPPESILGIYGIPHDDPRITSDSECQFDCALATGDVGEATGELRELELTGGNYLRLSHAGDYDLIHNAIDALYQAAVDRDLNLRDAPLYIHYLHDPDQVPVHELQAFVYLPIEETGP